MGLCVSKSQHKGEEDVNPFMSENERIQKLWTEADKDGDNVLNFREIKQLLHKLNMGVPAKVLKKRFKKFDQDGNRRFDFNEFKKFYLSLSSLPDVKEIFKNATGGDTEIMSPDELRRFLTSNGHTGMSVRECAELIMEVEMGISDDFVPTMPEADEEYESVYLTRRGFAKILANVHMNSVLDPGKVNKVYQDMSRPLSHYFISASHNTYLSGNQISDRSSVKAITHALNCGVRVIELDAWDGKKGQPIVTHGHAMCTNITFAECIEAIRDNAFVKSQYPVIISIENHCSDEQQIEQARILKDTLGPLLFQWEGEKDDNENVDWSKTPKTWLSPEDLKGKVAIRSKPKPSDQPNVTEETAQDLLRKEAESLKAEDENNSDDETTESEVKEVEELQKLMYIKNMKQRPKIKDDGTGVEFAKQEGVSSSSFKETKMLELAKPGERARDLAAYARDHLVRIYPRGSRVTSTNYDPTPAWNAGCQVVALNYQTKTMPVWLNQGKFSENGYSGYVLKPDVMMAESNLWTADFNTLTPKKLNIKLMSGHYLPKPLGAGDRSEVIDPYVEIKLHSLTKEPQSYKTKVVDNNGFNPVWNETIMFDVYSNDLDLLSFVVKDKDTFNSDDFIAQNVIPISSMRTGYRVIPLRQANDTPIPHAFLFAKCSWAD